MIDDLQNWGISLSWIFPANISCWPDPGHMLLVAFSTSDGPKPQPAGLATVWLQKNTVTQRPISSDKRDMHEMWPISYIY